MCIAIYRAGRLRPSDDEYQVSKNDHCGTWSMRRDVQEELEKMMKRRLPEKVVIAKFKRLEGRKMVDGCSCGCRGDWQLKQAGLDIVGASRKG